MSYYHMGYDPDINEKFENFTVKEVLADDDVVRFLSQDGRTLYVEVSTDCCDDSYFDKDSIEDMEGLVGQTLLSIESVETNAETTNPRPDDDTLHDREYQRVYCLVFKTNSSEISVLWRNDSNGCYYGSVEIKLVGSTSLAN